MQSGIPPDPEAKKAGWKEWYPVTDFVPSGHHLFRASAPNYNGSDKDQKLTPDALKFIVKKGIDSIISYNEFKYTADEEKRLKDNKIDYKHLKLGDFQPPTLDQLKEAYDFFSKHKSTLVHCGFGHGRTGTGITGLQIYIEKGRTLEPWTDSWVRDVSQGGNNVEKRGQVSTLAKQRNIFLPRVTGIPAGDPKKAFFVINFATGYYLTIDKGGVAVTTGLPEEVESNSPIEPVYQWVISKDSHGDYTLSNKKTPGFALTEPNAKVNDLVKYATSPGSKNSHFTIKEVNKTEKGHYVISPKPQTNLAIAIEVPNKDEDWDGSKPKPARLETKNESNEFGLWILLSSDFK